MELTVLHNIVIFSLFFVISILLFYFGVKYRKSNKYGSNSSILSGIILDIIGIITLVLNPLPYPLNAVITIWILIVFGVQFAYFVIIRYKFKTRGDKMLLDETVYDGGQLKLQAEFMRKGFHLVALLVFLCFYFWSISINLLMFDVYTVGPDFYQWIWQTSIYPYPPSTAEELDIAMGFTLMFFLAAVILLIIPDMFRIFNRKYSIFSGVYKKTLRMKEFYASGPQIYLTVSFTIMFLLSYYGIIHYRITLAAMAIAAFADAAAAVVGRKYGKHTLRTLFNKGEKSWEGLIAGFVVAYVGALIFVGPIVSIFGALTFSLIDYLNPKLADNILNPIFCSLAMIVPFIFFT